MPICDRGPIRGERFVRGDLKGLPETGTVTGVALCEPTMFVPSDLTQGPRHGYGIAKRVEET